jgi:hypothetical protein
MTSRRSPILLSGLPLVARRVTGAWLLGITLWLASMLALFH